MGYQKITNLVWIDLEMTGLDVKKDKIIQIAAIVTDTNLNILDENGYVAISHIDKTDVGRMEPFVKEMHLRNGLIQTALKSKLTIEQIDKEVVEYLSKFINKGESPLCGSSNSIDKSFIVQYMPNLHGFLHFRNIDVSTISQLAKLWNKKKEYHGHIGSHEALGDIKESIEELKHYKKELFD
ncbi:oligoribonuclease [Candidatus Dojkabacteria bacterium]|nr:oligoribonuclease [Candidatus Dojkabacteria bacterium]